MKKTDLKLSFLFLFLLLASACSKKEWDEYYGRPDWLGAPIYQQLEERQNFKSYLALVDKAGYKTILSSQGWWTVFAPNDAAVSLYLKENNISSIEQISEKDAQAIVKYSVVMDAYRKDQLTGFQVGGGGQPNMAYKRRTAYYDFVKDGPNAQYSKIIDGNSTAKDGVNSGVYIANDNNNKHIPYFIQGFMEAKELSAADYNAVFPNIPYTGFNVAGSSVVNADILAENGVIHEIDHVVAPLKNIDDELAVRSDYSEFKKLLDTYMVTYTEDADLTRRYNVLTGGTEKVYVKLYSSAMAFAPNSENYTNNTTEPQTDGFSMVAPSNTALNDYLYNPQTGILRKFKSFDAAPPSVLTDFLKAHMWSTTLWHSKLGITPNAQNERATFSMTDVREEKMMSNGMFYGINNVQRSNVFRTAYSVPYLDPAYLLFVRALEQTSVKYTLINPNRKFTVFSISDAQFLQENITYNSQYLRWEYTSNGVVQNAQASQTRVHRIVQNSIINEDLPDLSGKGVLLASNDEYIKYNNGKVFAAGNEDVGDAATVTGSENTVNGHVYTTSGVIRFTEKEIGFHLEKLAAQNAANFSHFYNYLRNSVIYNATTQVITGTSTGTSYTVFVPTNAAIEAAVKKGLLPGNTTTGAPRFSPAQDQVEKVSKFLKYHILNKKTVADDGKVDDAVAVETLLSSLDGEKEYINVTKQATGLRLLDSNGNFVNTTTSLSNNLSNRTLIHSINKVLEYAD